MSSEPQWRQKFRARKAREERERQNAPGGWIDNRWSTPDELLSKREIRLGTWVILGVSVLGIAYYVLLILFG